MKSENSPKADSRDPPSNLEGCRKCGRPGHFARDCFIARKKFLNDTREAIHKQWVISPKVENSKLEMSPRKTILML